MDWEISVWLLQRAAGVKLCRGGRGGVSTCIEVVLVQHTWRSWCGGLSSPLTALTGWGNFGHWVGSVTGRGAAATSRSWWMKAKPLGLSSQNHGRLPRCPGTLGVRVTLVWLLYKGWNSHIRKYLTQTLIGVGVAVINPNAENVRMYKSSFLADVVQQIWLSVVISFL